MPEMPDDADFKDASVMAEPSNRTHDYTKRGWGHDYYFYPVNGGLQGRICGWGEGIRQGDYLILQNGESSSTRYRVNMIRYNFNPPDQWSAEVEFAPRKGNE